VGNEGSFRAHSRSSCGCFTACVAAANDYDVESMSHQNLGGARFSEGEGRGQKRSIYGKCFT
jgi:hypothetical protein